MAAILPILGYAVGRCGKLQQWAQTKTITRRATVLRWCDEIRRITIIVKGPGMLMKSAVSDNRMLPVVLSLVMIGGSLMLALLAVIG